MLRRLTHFTLAAALVLALTAALPVQVQARGGLPQFAELAAEAGRSVVFIATEKTSQSAPRGQFRQQVPEGHPFKDFFDRFEQFFGPQGQRGGPRIQRGQGSGFVITRDGQIVTNNHVIDGADRITVQFQNDAKEYEATVIGRDKETDLAVIKIETDRALPTLRFGDSEAIQVGEWVLAIGNPFGLENTVTAGIISAKYRNLRVGPFDNFLQTDAGINPGNSGGPLLNLDGEVVGVNTLINAAGQSLGFAVPSNQAKRIIDQLREGKSVRRGWLGVTIQGVSENDAKALGLDEPTGALVAQVGEGQPADKAGVRQGDVILEVNGKKVADNNELLRVIAGLKPGERARLTLWRDGRRMTKNVTLGQRGEENMAALQEEQRPNALAQALGMTLKPVNDREASALGLDKTHGLLVVQVDPASAAAREGVRQGDVILQANQQDVNSADELNKVVERDKQRGVVMLLVKRQGQNLFVSLALED